MRSFHQLVLALFAFVVCALAQSDTTVYDSTVYITSTVYRVNTVTLSGSSPSASAMNMTSTIKATHAPTYPAVVTSLKGNGTAIVLPTGSAVKPSASQFTGAASAMGVNAYAVALAAGMGYLVL